MLLQYFVEDEDEKEEEEMHQPPTTLDQIVLFINSFLHANLQP